MESQSGVFLGQNSYPPFLVQYWVETKRQRHNLILWKDTIISTQMGSQNGHIVNFLTVTQVGMRSHLFRTKIRCFQGFSFFMYVSMLLERVPMGSRASSTWMTTSDESITYYKNTVRNRNDPVTLQCTNSTLTWCTILRGGWKQYLVKFSPDPLGLTLFEDFLTCFLSVTKWELKRWLYLLPLKIQQPCFCPVRVASRLDWWSIFWRSYRTPVSSVIRSLSLSAL